MTVTVAVPGLTPVSVISVPVTETVTTLASEEVALKVSASPSGSRKLSEISTSVTVPPTGNVAAAAVTVATGARLGGGGGGGSGSVPPSPPHALMTRSAVNAARSIGLNRDMCLLVSQ